MQRIADASLRLKARPTGVVYLVYFLFAIASQFFVGNLVLYDAANLIATAFYVGVTLLFYYLFRPVNRRLSLLAALFGLVGSAITALGLFDLVPSNVSPLAFFGPFCLLIGYLIYRSTFLPRLLGVLMALAGVGWLTFLSPLGTHLSPYLEILGVLAEGSLMLWLFLVGVNIQRWREQAGAAGMAGQGSTPRRQEPV